MGWVCSTLVLEENNSCGLALNWKSNNSTVKSCSIHLGKWESVVAPLPTRALPNFVLFALECRTSKTLIIIHEQTILV